MKDRETARVKKRERLKQREPGKKRHKTDQEKINK